MIEVTVLVEETIAILDAEGRNDQVRRSFGCYALAAEPAIVVGSTDSDVMPEHFRHGKAEEFSLDLQSDLFGGYALKHFQQDNVADNQFDWLDTE